MTMRLLKNLPVLALLLASSVLTVAAQQPAAPAPAPSKFKLTVTAYPEGSQIPSQYTCADPNVTSPGLQWTNPPANSAAFAVIFHDTDAAPQKNSMDVTHWTVWNIAGTADQLAADVKVGASPDGIVQGKNIRGNNGYQGPCPPPGATPHHYIYEIYALDQKLDLPAGASRPDLLKAMDGHVLGKATYVGLFSR
jgi:Raf kinase inhibitor-like YbhB/YbcL family protein